MVCKDGRVLDVLLSAVLDPGDAEHASCSLAVITDVSDLRVAQRKLAESQALYKGIVESQTELVSLATPEGELRFVNQAYSRYYDRTPSELVGTNLLDYVPAEVRSSVKEHIDRVCASKQVVESENQIVKPDGQKRWIEWTNRAILDPDGRVTAIHAVGRDIERRFRAEERLQASEARYRLLAEHSSDAVVLVRADGRRVYASPSCEKVLGWTPDEMLAATTQDHVHPEDMPRLRQSFDDDHNATAIFTYRVRRKDGAYIWVESATQLVQTPGEMKHRIVIVRNIHERIEADIRLKESEAKYRLLAENSGDMVFQVDRDLVRRYVSPASREILGYDPSELTGVRPLAQCHPDDAHVIAEAAGALLSGKADRLTVVNRSLHKDGHWVWVDAELKALKDPATGEICGIVGSLRDISARKAAEDKLAEANRRLEILATQDGLTGLGNRRFFDETFSREYRRALREGGSLALIMIDVDHFKPFNDRYGHLAGDACLKSIAEAIGAAVRRPADFAARYGGEEFVVLLPNTHEAGAVEIAERIRRAVRELKIAHIFGVDGLVTISAGLVASSISERGVSPDDMLRSADRALYRAKNAGRDRVCEGPPRPNNEDAAPITRREIA
jgi:diguanylate cyclase (GGDEF)-like protein/PAS domain S-box-containing protein